MDLAKTTLRGIGQIMLQNNAVTGLIFLIGIFVNSWVMGVGAILGVLSGTLFAKLMKYDDKEIADGLYGFNAALVGIALTYFYSSSVILAVIIIFGSFISTFVMRQMMTKKLSAYTFPFVITTWILIAMINMIKLAEKNATGDSAMLGFDIISSITMGFGQVMFQASILTGIIFLVAILINSRSSATFALAGSVIGMGLGLILAPISLVNAGLFGFNAVLSGIAFADRKKEAFIYAAISIIFSVLIMDGFIRLELISLTAPFVFSTWITLVMRKIIESRSERVVVENVQHL